jgi:four helix bundle protein|tara:strand:+ start:718 stop:1071 length:354 start_codon:yes stop_codon:yes gene_type:complete
MYNFERLNVYKRADIMSDVIHGVSMGFPKHEMYALGDQMRRAADSVVSNIAEGGRGGTNKEMIMFLRYALGSNNELTAQVRMVDKLGYLKDGEGDRILKELVEIGKMISGLIRRFRK